jgi:hypothetical protein
VSPPGLQGEQTPSYPTAFTKRVSCDGMAGLDSQAGAGAQVVLVAPSPVCEAGRLRFQAEKYGPTGATGVAERTQAAAGAYAAACVQVGGHPLQRCKRVANRDGRDFGWEMRSRGRFATPTDSPRRDGSPYSHVDVRRESLGFVHRARALFCRAVPNRSVTIRNFRIAVSWWPHPHPHAHAPQVGRASGVPVLDLWTLLQRRGDWRELLVDGLHFSGEGQKEVWAQLHELLDATLPPVRARLADRCSLLAARE